MAITLEQQRAADVWRKTTGCNGEYVNLAKGLPMLIMQSGLMQTLAFLHEKGSKSSQTHCKVLGDQLRGWLSGRFPQQMKSADFHGFMEALMKAEPRFYQQLTAEAYAWLRWVRQIAPARNIGAE